MIARSKRTGVPPPSGGRAARAATRWFALFVLGAALAVQAKGAVGAARSLPSDGVNPSYRNQLWRLSGRLIASDGAAISYAVTFFRYAEPHGIVLYPASVSILDESSGRLFSERRTEGSSLGLAGAATGPLSVRVGNWSLRESRAAGAAPAFDLAAKLADVALLVRGTTRKPPFALRTGTTEHAGFSSITSNGTIAIDGRRLEVRGSSWLDHELSNAGPSATAPAAEVRVQLDDGREIYVETAAATESRAARRYAYLIERDGTVDTLERDAYGFGEHPGSTWRSPHTRTIYPDVWGLHVNGKTEFLSLEPVAYDQESVAHGDGLSYWDGAVDVYDVTPGSQGRRLGSGFVLLHGYAAARKNR